MDSLELLALVAQGYVVRYFRGPQVLECWLLGPNLETVPFDAVHFEGVCEAARAAEAAERITHKPLDSGAIESYGYRPLDPDEPPANEPAYLNGLGTLELKWKGSPQKPGRVYRYYEVSRFHLQQFLKSASKRDYVINVIQVRGCSYFEHHVPRPAVAAETIRLDIMRSIDALAPLTEPMRTDSMQALWDSAPPTTRPEGA